MSSEKIACNAGVALDGSRCQEPICAGAEPIAGRDPNPAWDYVADFLFGHHSHVDADAQRELRREELAILLLNGLALNPNHFKSRELAAKRAAEALMGSLYVELWDRGSPRKRKK